MKTIQSRIGVCIIATLGLGMAAASALQQSVKVPLAGKEFGKGLEIHVSSGDLLLAASNSYSYGVVGSCVGTGDFSRLTGIPISTFLNNLSPGNSKYISGIYANPGGKLPITVIDKTFSGKLTLPKGVVNLSATVRAGITKTGEAYLDVVDVVVQSTAKINGTIKFRSGSKFNIGTAPLIQFKTPTRSVREDEGQVIIYVTRFGNTKGFASAEYTTMPTESSDFTPVSGTVEFGDRDTEIEIPVTILNNAIKEGNRSFTLVLSAPNEGTEIGPKSVITVEIRDDD